MYTVDWTLHKFQILLNETVAHIAEKYNEKEQTDEMVFAFNALVAMVEE